MESLFKKHQILISQTPTEIVRDVILKIHWEKQLVAIKGSRGVGKSTLMRQYIKQTYGTNAGEALYCMMDSLYFSTHNLLDLAEHFRLQGGKHLFLDEVHKYPTWSKEIKEIYDLYPDLKITFSGSSLIQILNADADLSRRALSYNMYGLSFREYLQFYKKISLPIFSLDDVLHKSDEVCQQVCNLFHPQKYFEEYLKCGYYPFFDGDVDDYYSRIENVVTFIIDQELPLFCGIEPAYTRKIKALLSFLSTNSPYDVNIAKLATYLEINKNTVLSYLSSLNRSELIHLLYSDNLSVTKMQKPDKIYISNTNIMNALCESNNIGTLRECFVVCQLSVNHDVEYGGKSGDFRIDGKYTFEVGGLGKSFSQIANIPNSYVLADDLEMPIGHKLPIWIVGFLY